jgi:hypothetical protein
MDRGSISKELHGSAFKLVHTQSMAFGQSTISF